MDYDNNNEALAIVKRMVADGQVSQDVAEKYFPELKESEDDKIRKFLINEVMGHLGMLDLEGDRIVNNVRNDLWKKSLAWLEKQGNTNKIITKNEFTHGVLRGAAINLITWIDNNAAKGNMCLSNMECKDIEDALVSCNWDKIYAYMKKKLEKQGELVEINSTEFDTRLQALIGKFGSLPKEELIGSLSFWINVVQNDGTYKPAEKQGEQMPTDKIEPKFKVGDWVVHDMSDGRVSPPTQIVDMTNKSYVFDTEECFYFSDAEEAFRKWTIQDAKDGDVLCCESGWTCIFRALDNHTNTFSSYCFMDSDKWFCNTGCTCHTLDEQFIRAYNFKLHPATKEQRDLLFQKMNEAGYEWDDEKKELNKVEQKSAEWSEEDSKMIEEIINDIECARAINYHAPKEDYEFRENWLKSLKDRYAWKPSKEHIIALRWVLNNVPYNKHKEEISGLLDQIKDL